MGTNIKDVYYCQMNRTTELSNRMSGRNIPSHQIGAAYFARPVDTYATVFPMVDCHKPATVTKASFPIYNQHFCLSQRGLAVGGPTPLFNLGSASISMVFLYKINTFASPREVWQ